MTFSYMFYIIRVQPQSYEDLVQAALAAIEADVTRAGSLALDLEIHVPPLFVSAPEAASHVMLGFKHAHIAHSENIFVRLKDPRKGTVHMTWLFIVSISALLAFWYYVRVVLSYIISKFIRTSWSNQE